MTKNRPLIAVFVLSIFSFGLFYLSSAISRSSVLGDSTQNTSTIPCQVITSLTNTYCRQPVKENLLLCQSLNNIIDEFCLSSPPSPAGLK